jgi:hypothetical protein
MWLSNILWCNEIMTNPPKRPRAIGLLNDESLPLRGQRRTVRDPAQPQLPFDSMPARIEPCLAVLANKPPTDHQDNAAVYRVDNS